MDVAVLRIDPAVAATTRPLRLGCAQAPTARVAARQRIFAIGALPLQPNDMTSGTVSRVDAHLIASDLLVPAGSEGGPVFAADGVLVGISSVADDPDARRAELIADYKERFANPYHAAERGYVDDVIEPRRTRPVLVRALEVALTKREPTPKRKHGNIPL